jgi:hypothetical protein
MVKPEKRVCPGCGKKLKDSDVMVNLFDPSEKSPIIGCHISRSQWAAFQTRCLLLHKEPQEVLCEMIKGSMFEARFKRLWKKEELELCQCLCGCRNKRDGLEDLCHFCLEHHEDLRRLDEQV